MFDYSKLIDVVSGLYKDVVDDEAYEATTITEDKQMVLAALRSEAERYVR